MNRLVYTGLALAMLATAGVPALAATPGQSPDASPAAAPSPASHRDWQARRQAWQARRQTIWNAELVGFKASLGLTPDQAKLWPAFETAPRNMATATMGEHPHPMNGPEGGMHRPPHMGAMGAPPSPVDAMHFMAKRLGERATQLTALANASAPLYASLDANQKLVFGATLMQMRAAHQGHWMRHQHG